MGSKLKKGKLLIAFTTSCSTVSDDDLGGKVESATQLNTGDVIRVVTAGYEDYRFRVTEITEVAIHGEKISIPFDTIRSLEIIPPNESPDESPDESSVTVSVTVLFIITAAGLLLLQNPFVVMPE